MNRTVYHSCWAVYKLHAREIDANKMFWYFCIELHRYEYLTFSLFGFPIIHASVARIYASSIIQTFSFAKLFIAFVAIKRKHVFVYSNTATWKRFFATHSMTLLANVLENALPILLIDPALILARASLDNVQNEKWLMNVKCDVLMWTAFTSFK